MPTNAEVVRKLLPLLDVRDLAIVLMDIGELVGPLLPPWRDTLHTLGAELLSASRVIRNLPVAPAEHPPSCEDVEPCS